MPKLPVVSGWDAVKAFEKAGWHIDRQHGSHIILLKKNSITSLSIPLHPELAPGTLRALIRTSGMSVDDFVELLQH